MWTQRTGLLFSFNLVDRIFLLWVLKLIEILKLKKYSDIMTALLICLWNSRRKPKSGNKLGVVTLICVNKLNYHWFRQWLFVHWAPSHYLNPCLDIGNWTLKNTFLWYLNQLSSRHCIWKCCLQTLCHFIFNVFNVYCSNLSCFNIYHYNAVIMGAIASQITSLKIVFSTVYLDTCRWKKTSKLRVTGLCAGNLPKAGEFPAQMASNAENVSIWWRHHDIRRWSSI